MKVDINMLNYIKDLVEQGATDEQIAELLSCSVKEIKDIMKKYDIYGNETEYKDEMQDIKKGANLEAKKKTHELAKYINGLTKQEADYVMNHKNESLIETSDYSINLCDVLLTRELNYMRQDCEADDDFSYKVHKTLQQTPMYETIFLANGEEHKVNSLKKQLLNSAIEEIHLSKKEKRDKYITSILNIMKMKEKFASLRIEAMKYIRDDEKMNADSDYGMKTVYVIPDNKRKKTDDDLDSFEELQEDMAFFEEMTGDKDGES